MIRVVELALARKVATKTPGRRAFSLLGNAAEGGKLWVAVAALLALGGNRGRRAAVEGLVALAASSAVTNGPLKSVTRRRRPGYGLGRFLVPQTGRAPKSSSLPSSHAASAAAFAAAAGLAYPYAAAPLAVASGAVAFSRVNTGRHFISDVGAGLIVGAAVGAAVHWAAGRVRPAPPATNDDAS
ncbi:MAG: hypothetical protein QOG90_2379 [Actinomycetota bacterium]